jgi:Flp pilus assembly protein TadB
MRRRKRERIRGATHLDALGISTVHYSKDPFDPRFRKLPYINQFEPLIHWLLPWQWMRYLLLALIAVAILLTAATNGMLLLLVFVLVMAVTPIAIVEGLRRRKRRP